MFKFASIDYLNLLPFKVYLKKRVSNTQFKKMIEYRKGVPSSINGLFKKGVIDGAFISSIHSKNKNCLDLGIVADGSVYSVLLVIGNDKKDTESATSNSLSKVLNLKGKVIIGDKALKYYLDGNEAIDLSLKWKEKTKLPFVFARLCCRKNCKKLSKLVQNFNSKNRKIPYYILKKESNRREIKPKDTIWYLSNISYVLNWREKKSLKQFLKKSRELRY